MRSTMEPGSDSADEPATASFGDVAVVHRGEEVNGGGERVAWELQRTFDAPLFVGYKDATMEPDDVTDVRQLFHGELSTRAIREGGFLRAAAYFLNWTLSPEPVSKLRKYDTLVTSGNEVLFYCGPDTQTQVHYVHHTSRRHTDLLHTWGEGPKGTVGRGYAFVIRQAMDAVANLPDLFVCNSEVVARRVRKYWGVPDEKIRVVYPPVDVDSYGPAYAETDDYYLSLSRLDWHKHVDEIVEAFNGTDRRLLVAGTGSEEAHLRESADDNVEFLGYVSEERKRELLAGARALVFAGEQEDFGIVTVESMASGTPVIAPAEGFTQYQIDPPNAGLTYDRGAGSLRRAVDRFERENVVRDEEEIVAHARRFSTESFRRGMREAVREARSRASVDVNWDDA